ncbi:MAG: VOC family protein [Nanoarchaeota archaeon]
MDIIQSIGVIKKEAEIFIAQVLLRLQEEGINFSHSPIGHVCYQVANVNRYKELHQVLLDDGNEVIYDNMFKLKTPINCNSIFGEYNVSCLELLAPRGEKLSSEGFRRLEFLVSDINQFAELYPVFSNTDISPGRRTCSAVFDGVTVKVAEYS